MKSLEDLIKERDEMRLKYSRSFGPDKKMLEIRGKLLSYAIEKKEIEMTENGFL